MTKEQIQKLSERLVKIFKTHQAPQKPIEPSPLNKAELLWVIQDKLRDLKSKLK